MTSDQRRLGARSFLGMPPFGLTFADFAGGGAPFGGGYTMYSPLVFQPLTGSQNGRLRHSGRASNYNITPRRVRHQLRLDSRPLLLIRQRRGAGAARKYRGGIGYHPL